MAERNYIPDLNLHRNNHVLYVKILSIWDLQSMIKPTPCTMILCDVKVSIYDVYLNCYFGFCFLLFSNEFYMVLFLFRETESMLEYFGASIWTILRLPYLKKNGITFNTFDWREQQQYQSTQIFIMKLSLCGTLKCGL